MSVIEGDGYSVGTLDDLGEGWGFRKVRSALGVTAFGVNGVVLPPGHTSPRHSHETQEELYFVHSGSVEFQFGDGSRHTVGPGGLARIAPETIRALRNTSDAEDAVYLCVGGHDGYVGRDGRPAED